MGFCGQSQWVHKAPWPTSKTEKGISLKILTGNVRNNYRVFSHVNGGGKNALV